MDPWNIELIVVRDGSLDGGARRALARDTARGLFRKVRQGVWVRSPAWDAATGFDGDRQRHIVRMRALDAVARRPAVFSHWSAAVLHGLPETGAVLQRVHTTVDDERLRGLDGVAAHLFTITPEEITTVNGLLVTSPARTVVDLAGDAPFAAGVRAADAALLHGLPRELLEQAVDLAGPRKAARRILDVIAFAHPGAESPIESDDRCTKLALGIAPMELQHVVRDGLRFVARVDSYDPHLDVANEADGDSKYLGQADHVLLREKRREDDLRLHVRALVRYGAAAARSPALLRPLLAKVGIHPARARPTLADYAAVARTAHPSSRFVSR